MITASTTTFGTGLPTTVGMPRSGSSTFSTPQSAITQGIEFYNNWLNNNLDNGKSHHHSRRDGNDTGAIVGGVVGGVCGILGCGLATWVLLRRRRNKKKNTLDAQGFSEEIGSRVENTSPTESPRGRFQENPGRTINDNPGNNGNQLFSIFRTKEIPPAPSEDMAGHHFNSIRSREAEDSENPFHDKFNFAEQPHTQAQVTPPPVPPPRKMHSNTQHPNPSRSINSSHENLSSLASSLNDSSLSSSLHGDYSMLSSGPIRLGHSSYGDNMPENPTGGFFREII